MGAIQSHLLRGWIFTYFTIGKQFIDTFIESYPREPEVIIIDCDDTNNNTYGQQELSLFNIDYHGKQLYVFYE